MEFENKVALITGASVGIGRATAILMAQKGAKLALIDINKETLDAVKEELLQYTSDILTFVCDISNEKEVIDTTDKIMALFGKVDILVNNAAIWRIWKPFCDITTYEWKKFFDINVFGVVYFTKAVLPGMLERKYGRVINVSSIAGVIGNANMVNYSATKGAVISMTKALAKETTSKGVTINSVSPGSVSPSENHDIDYWENSELSFAGRTGTDRENAELICYLASDAAAYISGQNIQIDGCRKRM